MKIETTDIPELNRTGVHLHLHNGWTVSAQQGPSNYSGDHTVELWAWNETTGENHPEQGPRGYQDEKEFSCFLMEVANF